MAYLQQYADDCAHHLQVMSMQPPMQGMQPAMSPYTIELNNAASAAGYWADHLSADEQQQSYLAMQQVDCRPCIITVCAVHGCSPQSAMLISVPSMCSRQCGF